MDTSDITLKRCSRKEQCVNPLGSWLPATPEFFYRQGIGLKSVCKTCYKEISRQRYHANIQNEHDRSHAYNVVHNSEITEKKRQRYIRDREKRHQEYLVNYAARHEHMLEINRRSKAKHRERSREYNRQYELTHREHHRKWLKRNVEKSRLHTISRRTRKRSLPDAFSLSDWQRALGYFHGCCAVCGRPLYNLFTTHKAAADHWIPLSSPTCPGTIPKNIVPLCHGEGGCNNSKSNTLPDEWLIRKFGKRKAKQILARIQAYFDSLN